MIRRKSAKIYWRYDKRTQERVFVTKAKVCWMDGEEADKVVGDLRVIHVSSLGSDFHLILYTLKIVRL
jgi:hypothetical protein